MLQIFWFEVHLEQAMLVLIYSGPSIDTALLSMIVEAAWTAVPCVAGAILMRAVFRWGNRKLIRWPKRERDAAKLPPNRKREPVRANAWVGLRPKLALINSVVHQGKKRRRQLRMMTAYEFWARARHAAAWGLALLIEIVCLLSVLIQASLFGEAKAQGFLYGFLLSLSTAWIFVEPIEAFILNMLPRQVSADETSCLGRTRMVFKEVFY